MKKILALLCLLTISFYAFGQVKKIEKKSYGLLDSVLYVNGSDTICIESFHGNGIIATRSWKKDSLENFNYEGTLFYRESSHIKHQFGYANPHFRYKVTFENDKIHQSKRFYSNGALFEENGWHGDTVAYLKIFEPTGTIVDSITWYKRKDANGNYHAFHYTHYRKNQPIEAKKIDTLLNFYIDSTFKNGKLIEIEKRALTEIEVLELTTFDDKGKINYHWLLDSTRLHPDKDNGDCLYGFRNMRGDWLIPPQYDNVQSFNIDYFIVNKNEKYGIIDDFGKTILPVEYDFLGLLSVDDKDIYDDEDFVKENIKYPLPNMPLRYRAGAKYGVLDFRGKVLLPPQYDDVRKMQGDTFEVQIGRKWGLVNGKGRVIVKPNYYKVNFTQLPSIFEIVDTVNNEEFSFREQEVKGLINDKGKILLNTKFETLEQQKENPNTFFVKSLDRNHLDEIDSNYDGVFDLKKGWIVDTLYLEKNDGVHILVQKNPDLREGNTDSKYGIINEKYKTILPFEYDEINTVEHITFDVKRCDGSNLASCLSKNIYYICQKDKKYGIFDLQTEKWLTPLKYDFIYQFYINKNDYLKYEYGENNIVFLALKEGKWRWIDVYDKQLSDDLMDYAGYQQDNLFTIKDNKITLHHPNYYPQNMPFELEFSYDRNANDSFMLYRDFVKGDLLVNRKGALVLPPQYSIVSQYGKYVIANDDKGIQWIFDDEGTKRPFLTEYKIHLAQIKEGIVIVEDPQKRTLGVVSPEGKVIIPIRQYAVTALDNEDIIWVKEKSSPYVDDKKKIPKTPLERRKTQPNYWLNSSDNDWLMFNKKGEQLTTTTFAFPFKIHHNHGIGIIRLSENSETYKAGIWRTSDGKNLLPPQYDQIYFSEFNRLYYIYKKDAVGMKVGVCDTTGRIMIEPKLDRIGFFYGEYAIIQEGGKLGLITRDGQYKIPPQYNAFKNTSEDIDSLLSVYMDSVKKKMEKIENPYDYQIPYEYQFQYNLVYKKLMDMMDKNMIRVFNNLIIEKITEGAFIDRPFVTFDRSNVDKYFHHKESKIQMYKPQMQTTIYTLKHFHQNEKSIGFILWSKISFNTSIDQFENKSYNYTKNEKGEWIEVQIEDLLDLSPDNRLKINQLIIDKVRNLKDAGIDCSNSDLYFTFLKNRFYIENEGIKVSFAEHWWLKIKANENTEILLTWDDLKPFLTKKG
jgi:hypothetical protein